MFKNAVIGNYIKRYKGYLFSLNIVFLKNKFTLVRAYIIFKIYKPEVSTIPGMTYLFTVQLPPEDMLTLLPPNYI